MQKAWQIPNPFIPDIRVLFSNEYAAAMCGRDIFREITGRTYV